MATKWGQNGDKIKRGDKMAIKWRQNGVKMATKWRQNGQTCDKMTTKNDEKMATK